MKLIMNIDSQEYGFWYLRYKIIMHIFSMVYTSFYMCTVILFLIDMFQFFYFNTCMLHTTLALYSALLPFISLRLFIFQTLVIGLSSLYTHDFMFLHLLALIPLTILFHFIKRFFYITSLLPLSFTLLFLSLDSLIFWLINLSSPLKNFTIVQILGTLGVTWLFARVIMFTGERDNRTTLL